MGRQMASRRLCISAGHTCDARPGRPSVPGKVRYPPFPGRGAGGGGGGASPQPPHLGPPRWAGGRGDIARHDRVRDGGHALPEHGTGVAVPLGPVCGLFGGPDTALAETGVGTCGWGEGGGCSCCSTVVATLCMAPVGPTGRWVPGVAEVRAPEPSPGVPRVVCAGHAGTSQGGGYVASSIAGLWCPGAVLACGPQRCTPLGPRLAPPG